MSDSRPCSTRERFRRISCRTAEWVGSYWAFALSISFIIAWAATGPLFHFSDTWQLVINTATTIITFLMVFLIQNTQNRDAKAIHLKLDELIRSTSRARNSLVNLENLTDEDMARLQNEFAQLQKRAQLKAPPEPDNRPDELEETLGRNGHAAAHA